MRRNSFRFPTLLVLAALWVTPSPAHAADEDEYHHHHLYFFSGLGVESKDGREDEPGFAIGGGYGYRFSKRLGVAVILEGLGQDTVRNYVLIVPLRIFPGGNWNLVIGPGIESTPKKDKFAFRLGGGYDFHLPGNFTLAPEAYLDLIETGENTWVFGFALGYEF